jgi:hypothetical protein
MGVAQEGDTRAIVYSLAGRDGASGYVSMAIPTGFIEEDLIVLASTGQGDALASQPRAFKPYSCTTPGVEPEIVESVILLDYRRTVGAEELPEDHPRIGLVQLLDDDGQLVHEAYLYDERLSAWVRVGTLELDEGPSSRRTLTAVVLTPVTVAVDVLTVFVLLLVDYKGPTPSISFTGEDLGTGPVPMPQREMYWRSLGPGTSERGARIPARKPIAGDWIFEVRTDR